MKMEKKTFRTYDGAELAYFDSGAGDLTAVLLAGYGAPAISWCQSVKALNRAGIRAVALDRRCHGLSEVTRKGMDMLSHGRDVHALFEALGLDGVVLVGHSQGASAAWAYVSQFGDGRLRGVVSADQTPKIINGDGWDFGQYGLTRETRPAFFDNRSPAAPERRPLDKGLELYLALHARGYPKFDRELTKPLLLDHADADWRAAIAGLSVPALFIAGGESPFWPPEHAAAAAALAPKGESLVMPGCGHAVNWERPREFNRALLGFIRRL